MRGEDFTPRPFRLMLAQIILHAEFFGIADPKIIRLADAIISDEVVQPEDWRAGKIEKGDVVNRLRPLLGRALRVSRPLVVRVRGCL